MHWNDSLRRYELTAMKAEHDPLASHIFVSRRSYRSVNDTKSGKRREMRTVPRETCFAEIVRELPPNN
jgi:hypothetical protein